MDKVVDFDDLYTDEEVLLSLRGEPGRILYDLVQREGRATWIPKFVNWLFQEYEIKRKNAAPQS